MRKSTTHKMVSNVPVQLFGILAFALMPLVPAHAQSQNGRVAVPIMQQSPQWQNLPRPHFGQSMDSVRKKYGAPKEIKAPRGKPAITRWVYPKFTVYFEAGRVIDTVLNHQ